MNPMSHSTQPRFEETYRKAPFSELIRLSVLLAGGFATLRAWLSAPSSASTEIAQGR